MTPKEIFKVTQPLHLLYVEDEENVRQTSLELFENFFDTITTAENGLEGLNRFKEGGIDIIISDISMPVMDGIDFLTYVRQKDKGLPLIIYSAWNNASSMPACIALNIDAYLLKPIQMKNILDVLEKVACKTHFHNNA
jgi:YesN/AraC family two-component response regulator